MGASGLRNGRRDLYNGGPVSSRIEQVLAYLDRDGVSEIILGVGRPLSLRRNGQVVPVTGERRLTGVTQLARVEHDDDA